MESSLCSTPKVAKEIWTIKKLLVWTTDFFIRNEIKTARLDAEVLLAHTLETDRLSLYLDIERPLQPDELQTYRSLITRRCGREPIAYIIGKKEFWSLDFQCNKNVLIPRPDTEILISTALKIAKEQKTSSPSFIEIGTGSGIIPISLAKELPESRYFAIDSSEEALKVAKKNATKNNVENNIHFICSDLLTSIKNNISVDFIISNPPYIPTADIETLSPEVKKEPKNALDGGTDGLSIIREIIKHSKKIIKKGGCLLMEIGFNQAQQVEDIAEKYYENADFYVEKDYAGKDRVAIIK